MTSTTHPTPLSTDSPARLRSRRLLRRFAAGLAVITAILYLVIATDGVHVVDTADEPNGVFLAAAVGFLIGGVVALMTDRRWLWITGAALDAFVIYAYFDIASDRSPSFEAWGLSMRVPQVLLLIILVVLGRSKKDAQVTD